MFASELAGLDRDEIRAWYNGYRWGDDEDKVYNPFCLLKLFRSRLFRAHWFETATPRFLIDTLLRRGFAAPDLERVDASETLLSTFDLEFIAPEALLFQTGYLTITGVEEQPNDYPRYRLDYPNREVRRGLNEHLLDALAPNWRAAGSGAALRRVLAAEAWKRCCASCWPAFRTIGIGGTTSLATRGTGRACSTLGSRRRWMAWPPRTPPAAGAWTWPCASAGTLPVRVQGVRAVGVGRRAGPVAGAQIRRQVPRRGPSGPPDRRRDQRRDPHHRRIPDRPRLKSRMSGSVVATSQRPVRATNSVRRYLRLRGLRSTLTDVSGGFDILRSHPRTMGGLTTTVQSHHLSLRPSPPTVATCLPHW